MLGKTISPMEPISVKEPFNDAAFLFQVKWDGIRALAFITQKSLRLQTRNGVDITDVFPELHALIACCQGSSAILDGELVVLTEHGFPSFRDVLRRFHSKPHKQLLQKLPVVYMIFDILYHNGSPTLNHPLNQRQSLLWRNFSSHPNLQLVDSFYDGHKLFAKIKELQMEGIVAKKISSIYHLGCKHPDWQKIKCWKMQACIVGGLALRNGQVASILLGAYRGNELYYLGRASSGLSNKDRRTLLRLGDQQARNASAFINPPVKKSTDDHILWLAPQLTVQIEFLEWTSTHAFRSPRIIGFTLTAPKNCRLGESICLP